MLPAELDYLAAIPRNSKKAKKVLRLMMDAEPNRLNFTINRKDAERMEGLCLAKNVPRDAFIRGYLQFLVTGAPGVCEGPLSKVSAILANPRHEYEEKTCKDIENPYNFLHLSEEKIAEVNAIMHGDIA
jgi:hypothetical protein